VTLTEIWLHLNILPPVSSTKYMLETTDSLSVVKTKCYIIVTNLSAPTIKHGYLQFDIHIYIYFASSLAILY
jgi:hypothetical protein